MKLRRAFGCAALLVSLAVPSAASAAPSAVAYLPGTSFSGVDATIRSNYLSVPNTYTDFVNNHVWIYNSSFAYWVEAGINIGTSTQLSVHSPTFEWIDSRPGGGYHEHILGYVGDAALNTYYDDSITYGGGGNWYVEVAGYTATSTGNITSGQNIFAGSETTIPASATICASQSSLAYYDSLGHYHFNWNDGEGVATLPASNPPYAYFVQPQNWAREYDNVGC